MPELELTRSRDDRRRFEIVGVGALRLGGLFSRGANARAEGTTWAFERRGLWHQTAEATDAAGTVVGVFDPRTARRGGTLRWGDRELELRPASRWKERYALADDGHELAVLDGRGWGRRPVRITIDEPRAVDPGLLLFAAFVVRGLAEDAGAAAASSAPAPG